MTSATGKFPHVKIRSLRFLLLLLLLLVGGYYARVRMETREKMTKANTTKKAHSSMSQPILCSRAVSLDAIVRGGLVDLF